MLGRSVYAAGLDTVYPPANTRQHQSNIIHEYIVRSISHQRTSAYNNSNNNNNVSKGHKWKSQIAVSYIHSYPRWRRSTAARIFCHNVCASACIWVKVKVHTLDIAPLRSESPPQKSSGMARVLKGFHSVTCTPTRSSAVGMSHTCLCLPSRSWYLFTDPEGWKAE